MEGYLIDWLNLGVRWLHMIAGIAWIGASFYFIMLDLSLQAPKRAEDIRRGVAGELWAVHGGGFYVSQKFAVGPKGEPLAEDLHWSKWEAYTTWLSGMALLAIIYWWGANTHLIDRSVLDLSPATAIAISAASLVTGWLVYDALCRAVRNETVLAVILYVLTVAAAWGYHQVFGARAAYIHVGALIGTIMVWNVFFHIIPGQKKMVAEIRAGQEPDPRPGIIGKQRSVHNTYFTLPVIFAMLSNHYSFLYTHSHNWLVLFLMMAGGAGIRQFFVQRHGYHLGRASNPLPWAIAGVLIIAAVIVWLAPTPAAPTAGKASATNSIAPNADSARAGGQNGYETVAKVLEQRCLQCHGAQVQMKNVRLDSPEQVKVHAQNIYQQVVVTRQMPMNNATQITDAERALIGDWFKAGAKTP